MHRPLWRHDSLIVVQPYYTTLLRLTHDVGDGLLCGEVEIVVGLDTAAMGVRRHRVPGCTGIELRQAKLQLAGTLLEHIVHDKLVDRTVVALLKEPTGPQTAAFNEPLRPSSVIHWVL